jgi:transposase
MEERSLISSVGIDLSRTGSHQARCLDEQAIPCDSFTFDSTMEGLETLEKHVFLDGATPTIVFEPTGLAWIPLATYLRARHPESRLVKARLQKVAALRKYIRGHAKSDRVDGVTLAKMPFIDSEQLEEAYLPPAEYHALQRLTRQRERLMKSITIRKNRIGAIVEGYLPGLRAAFTNEWSVHARAFYRSRLNPFAVVRDGKQALQDFLTGVYARGSQAQSHRLHRTCQTLSEFYNRAEAAGMVNEDFFNDLQDEIARELRLMDAEETEVESVSKRVEELYRRLHPSDNLRTIPGIGVRTAQVFLAVIGDPHRFRSQSAFANWTGVVPGANQSSDSEGKGLRMTKAGPAMMKRALYQAGDIARRYDPQLAYLYYREMVHHGKTHLQAMGAVMSHLAARILTVLQNDRPYELRDIDGRPVSKTEAIELIQSRFRVSEEIRQARRHRKSHEGRPQRRGTREAAEAPQSRHTPTSPMPVYSVTTEQSMGQMRT